VARRRGPRHKKKMRAQVAFPLPGLAVATVAVVSLWYVLWWRPLLVTSRDDPDGNNTKETSDALTTTTTLRSEAQDHVPCDVFERAEWTSRLPKVTEMNLAKCGLTSLSPRVALCSNLRKLDLAFNDLETLPMELAQLTKLEVLFVLGSRRMTRLPSVLRELTTVTRLGLRSNGLKEIDGNLPPNVQHLILTDNFIERIADWSALKNVRKLMLANNKLTTFEPADGLGKLELLRLANNDLASIAPSVLTLPNLAWIALNGNPRLFSSSGEKHFLDKDDETAPRQQTPRRKLRRAEWADVDFGEKPQHLGSGASGVVRAATWQHAKVAVKQLQDRGSDGRATDEVAAIDALYGGDDDDGDDGDDDAVEEGSSFTKKTNTATTIPSSLVWTYAVLEKEDKASSSSYGVIMELLPRGVRDLAKPPTIVEMTRDRYRDAEQFSPRFATTVLAELGRALTYLHAKKVAHGDVYAHNTLVDAETNAVKLGDLGAAFCYGGFFLEGDAALLFEKIEVRAFGILMEELNARLSNRKATVHRPLGLLARDCLQPDVRNRPTFKDIQPRLDALHADAIREEN